MLFICLFNSLHFMFFSPFSLNCLSILLFSFFLAFNSSFSFPSSSFCSLNLFVHFFVLFFATFNTPIIPSFNAFHFPSMSSLLFIISIVAFILSSLTCCISSQYLSSFILPTCLKLTIFFFSLRQSPFCSCHLLYNSHCNPQWSESTRPLISIQYSIWDILWTIPPLTAM